ncbi:MAG: DUF4831 family protein [Bacteroidales bacterium]|nr:DUF4831 family protein [Bacteroidales bacterium]
MKNKSLLKYHLLFLSAFIFFIGNAQVNVHHVTGETNINDKQGIFYSLPRTLVKVDIVVEKTEYFAGPYAEYASKYLDMDGVITSDYNEYKIADAKLSSLSEPDPDQYYFIEIDEKAAKENKSLIFSLSAAGLIMGLDENAATKTSEELMVKGIDGGNAYSDIFQYFAATNLYSKSDTIIRKVVVDTIVVEKIYLDKKWVEKSSEQKAVEAANMVSKIRESRYNLLTGYQEIPYDAGSISYMDNELKNMEKEYLSLFIGISFKKTFRYSFTVYPDPNEQSSLLPVFVFSSRSGIKDVNSSGGEKIYIRVERNNNAQQIINISNSKEQADKNSHGFYYRIPETTRISLEINNDLKIQGYYQISQFGAVTFLPSSVSSVQFHPETGGVKKVIFE